MTRRDNLLLGALAAPAMVLTLAACNVELEVGESEVRTHDVAEFDRIDIGGAFDAEIVVGESTMVEIDAGENVHDKIEVTVEDGELKIDLDNVTLVGVAPLNATIHTPDLTGLDSSGAAEIDITGLDTDEFDLDLSGASEVRAEGRIDTLTLDASGASDLDFDDVEIESAEIDVSGASNVDLTSTALVTGDVSGASNVDVGDDTSVRVETSGAANVD